MEENFLDLAAMKDWSCPDESLGSAVENSPSDYVLDQQSTSTGSNGITISATSFSSKNVQALICKVLQQSMDQVKSDNMSKSKRGEVTVTLDCGRELAVPLYPQQPKFADLHTFVAAGPTQLLVQDCIYSVNPTDTAQDVWVGLVVPACWSGQTAGRSLEEAGALSVFERLKKENKLNFRLAYSSLRLRSKKCEFQPCSSGLELHRIGPDTSKQKAEFAELEGSLHPRPWRFFFKEPENMLTLTEDDKQFVARLSEKASTEVVEYLEKTKKSLRNSNSTKQLQDQIRKKAFKLFSDLLAEKMDSERKRKKSAGGGEDDGSAESAACGSKQARTEHDEVPDFVFLDTYVKLTISEIEYFIQQNGHLPWMRSAEQVGDEGFDIKGDFMRLHETVENVMLAVIDIDRKTNNFESPDGAHGGKAAVKAELERWTGESLMRALTYAQYVRQPEPEANTPTEHATQVGQKVMTRLKEVDMSEQKIGYYAQIVRALSKEGSGVLEGLVEDALEAVAQKETTRSAAGEFLHLFNQRRAKNSCQELLEAIQSKEHPSQQLTPRGYQKEMANKAIEQNCIVVAETGCGKTKVISMVLDALWSKKPSGKVIVVIQNIPLALQQFGALTSLCRRFENGNRDGPRGDVFGSFRPPKGATWDEFLVDYNFIVITPVSLLNFLQKLSELGQEPRFLSNSMIDWLVFDECHHCKDDHPFRELMDKHVHAIDTQLRPRVLGVTACVGGAEGIPRSLERIRELEKAMGATVFSSFHLTEASREELKQNSARVKEVKCAVKVNELEAWFEEQISHLLDVLKERKAEMETKRQASLKEGVREDRSAGSAETCGKNNSKQQRREGVAGVMDKCVGMVNEAMRVARDAGVYDALCWLGREYLSLLLHPSTASEAGPLLPWLHFQFNHSNLFADLRIAVPTCPRDLLDAGGYARKMVTSKQEAFVDKLLQLVDEAGGGSQFQGMVFLRTRHGVKAARKLLFEIAQGRCLELARHTDAVKAHIVHRAMVGKGSKVLTESASSQFGTIIAFREKKFNLLLATSVAEEGMDFSKCNAVFRMDGAESDIALVQSKGRVRAHGNFVVFYRTGEGRSRMTEETLLEATYRKRDNGEKALEMHAHGSVKGGSDSGPGMSRCNSVGGTDVLMQSDEHHPVPFQAPYSSLSDWEDGMVQPLNPPPPLADEAPDTSRVPVSIHTAASEAVSSGLEHEPVQNIGRRVANKEGIMSFNEEEEENQQSSNEEAYEVVAGELRRAEHDSGLNETKGATDASTASTFDVMDSDGACPCQLQFDPGRLSEHPSSESVLRHTKAAVSDLSPGYDHEETVTRETDVVIVDATASKESVHVSSDDAIDATNKTSLSTIPRPSTFEPAPFADPCPGSAAVVPSPCATAEEGDSAIVPGEPSSRALKEWTTDEVCELLEAMGPKFAKAREVCQREDVNGEDLESFFQDSDAGLDVTRNPLYMSDHLGLNEIQVRKLRRRLMKPS